eukprot:Hpha_TRINITY_DN15612_c4_g1::TRINITY_DN15612_c4_g1_i1::g.101826::m.101826
MNNEKEKGERTCCRCEWLVREGDTREEVRIKTGMFPVAVFFLIFDLFNALAEIQGNHQNLLIIGMLISATNCGLFVVGLLTNRIPAGVLLDVWLVVSTVGLCLIDIANVTITYAIRSVMAFVLLLDASLVFARDHISYCIIAIVLLHITALAVESYRRFGLYELGYWGTVGSSTSSCSCPSPPCDNDIRAALTSVVAPATFVLGDYYFTRRFAHGMRLHIRTVEASVEVAGEIAAALARYD